METTSLRTWFGYRDSYQSRDGVGPVRPSLHLGGCHTGLMDDDFDLAGALGTAPAATAALAWVQTIRHGRFDAAWTAMADDFRLVCVQDWII